MQVPNLIKESGEFIPLRQKANISIGKAGSAELTAKQRKLKKACEDFEALFIYQLLKVMRKSIPKDNYLNGGMGQDVFLSLMDQHLAEKISQQEPLGIAKMLYQKLSEHLEHSSQIKGRGKLSSKTSIP